MFSHLANIAARHGKELLGTFAAAAHTHDTDSDSIQITHLIIPHQVTAASEHCEISNNELVNEAHMNLNLTFVGWIHSHPVSQPPFPSSLDCHTQYTWQRQFAQCFATIVSKTKKDTEENSFTFRLSRQGMEVVGGCEQYAPTNLEHSGCSGKEQFQRDFLTEQIDEIIVVDGTIKLVDLRD